MAKFSGNRRRRVTSETPAFAQSRRPDGSPDLSVVPLQAQKGTGPLKEKDLSVPFHLCLLFGLNQKQKADRAMNCDVHSGLSYTGLF